MREPEVWLGVVVLVVVLGGVILLTESFVLTGHVVADPCSCAPGAVVCGAVDHRLQEYSSACVAECVGARVVFEGRCTEIPKK